MHRRSTTRTGHIGKRRRAGFSYGMTVIFLLLLAAVGMAMMQNSGMDLRKAVNQRDGLRARLAAESGVAYFSGVVSALEIQGDPTSEVALGALAPYLAEILPGGIVSTGGGQIHTGAMSADSSSSFTGDFMAGAEERVHLQVVGQADLARRTIGIDFELVPGKNNIFSKGIVSAGPIHVSGSAWIEGANNPSEADVLSLSQSGIVFDLSSNCDLDGDLYTVSDDPEAIDLSGSVTVAGISRSDPAIYDHIHLGVEQEELPRPDTSEFTALATTVLTGPPVAGQTYTNLRIPAGTNPTFNDNSVLEGVLYIESPNVVTFGGGVTVTGVIVTDDPGPGATASNQILFQGNATLLGVESLPDDPAFDELRAMPGSSILAPGFLLTMTGSMGCVGGTIAAETISLQGNAEATIRGTLMSLGGAPVNMGGSTHIVIDRSEYDDVPAGFTVPLVLQAMATTYSEE